MQGSVLLRVPCPPLGAAVVGRGWWCWKDKEDEEVGVCNGGFSLAFWGGRAMFLPSPPP